MINKRFNDWLAELVMLQMDEAVLQDMQTMYEAGIPPQAVINMARLNPKVERNGDNASNA